jgi:peptide subunit release factor 1 (eRF1)
VADELVAAARQTDARVTFIEDPTLLAEAGGVGAILRYRLQRRAA